MIVLIDNYDSFTFNLFHYLGGLGAEVVVHRNDKIAADEVIGARSRRDRAVARPLHAERRRHLPRPDRQGGGDHPDPRRLPRPSGDRAGVRRQGGARAGAGARQALARSSTRATASSAASMGRSRRRATIRWWSSAPACRRTSTVTAETDDRLVMGLAHARLPVHGVQFHPESIASEHGHLILQNFLDIAAAWNAVDRTARPAGQRAARRSDALRRRKCDRRFQGD